MDAQAWNARYAADDLVWSAEPNRFVAEVVGPMPAGRALDLACGEGRNAIWLAERGWQVTAVDFSDVAVTKGARLAERRSGQANGGSASSPETDRTAIDWRCADVVEWEPPRFAFDLVLLCYLQLPAEQLAAVLRRARRALAPGGYVLVIGHARRNLHEGVGGPQDERVLYEPEDVLAGFGDVDGDPRGDLQGDLDGTGGGTGGSRVGRDARGTTDPGDLDVERAEHVFRTVTTDEGDRRAIDTLVLARRTDRAVDG